MIEVPPQLGQGLGAVLDLPVSNVVIHAQDHDQVPPEVLGVVETDMEGVVEEGLVLLGKEADPQCLTGGGISEIGTLRKFPRV